MRYQDKKCRFSFDIPDGWHVEHSLLNTLSLWFLKVNVSLAPDDDDANINVACGRIESALENVDARDRALLAHITRNGGKVIRSGSINDELAGERNTVIAEYARPSQQPGRSLTKVSTVHKQIEYTITFGGETERNTGTIFRV